ncbi:MAG TPA: c-type cytochrome [Candidatus Acidoferrales bacterium]|nr:c-type cytochrome [Candidatus Acidoferrales bacterium]
MNSVHKSLCFLILSCLLICPMAAQKADAPAQQGIATAPPPWAYGMETTTGAPPPDRPDSEARGGADDGTPRHLPTSKFSFTLTQLRNIYAPADWYPEDHPAMPNIVAHGHKPDVTACSFCHYPNGKGRPVNTNLAGLPYTYILHTLEDFKMGARGSADTRKSNTNQMIKFATMMSDDEKKDAAHYFSSMKWTPWIRVVESDTIPKMLIANGIYLRAPGNDTQSLGDRIIETPENVEATEVLRDDRSGFVAYVPPGSIKKGESLVMTGTGGKTIACTTCHGSDLMGMDPVPGLAGRSPSYLVRQMYDMQHGFRTGEWTAQMKPVVAKLSADDMMAIAAYLSSRSVAPAASSAASK